MKKVKEKRHDLRATSPHGDGWKIWKNCHRYPIHLHRRRGCRDHHLHNGETPWSKKKLRDPREKVRARGEGHDLIMLR